MEFGTIVIAVAYGLVTGSFLNVCIHRVPERETLWTRSRCPHCRKQIAFYDNVPLLSFLLLRGQCRHCHASISWRYPLIEALTALIFLLAFWRFGLTWNLLPVIPFACMIVVLTFIDLDHMILPDVITLPGALMGLLLCFWQDPVFYADALTARLALSFPQWSHGVIALCGALLGGIAGGGLLWLVAELYFRWRKIEGLGFGDVKMMALVGAFLGWKYALLTIFLGSFSGAIIGGIYIYLKRLDSRYQLPFGVFLGIAALVSLFAGPEILGWYLGFYE